VVRLSGSMRACRGCRVGLLRGPPSLYLIDPSFNTIPRGRVVAFLSTWARLMGSSTSAPWGPVWVYPWLTASRAVARYT
jgi:hypothetical protein